MDGHESELSEEIGHDRSMLDAEAEQEGNSLIEGEEGNADEGGSIDQ
jgi:hypothetical protein